MIEKHFANWDYYAVQELEEMCTTMPVLPSERAKEFFRQANRATKSREDRVADRQPGKLFESMMGFVGASDRKDFSARCDDSNPGSFGYGIMVVETYDRSIGVTFCLARISEATFSTCGWIGEDERQAVKTLLSKQFASTGKKWWKVWK